MGALRKTKLSVVISMLVASNFSGAAVITVNSTGDGIVEDGVVTLREALEAANSNMAVNADLGAGDVDGDVIQFDATMFAPANSATILTTGLTISDDLFIDGMTGGVDVTVDGGNANRILDVDTGEPVDIDGLTFIDGNVAGGNGGAIRLGDGGDLVLNQVTVSGSVADSGGAIEVASGELALLNSSIVSNSAQVNGGGVHVSGAGTVSIANSVIQGNTASQEGGGFWNSATGSLRLTGSVVSSNAALIANAANDAQGGGGVFNNGGTVTITNSYVIFNAVSGPSAGADDGGGGIFNDGRHTAGARIDLTGTTYLSVNTVLSTSLNGGGGLNIGMAGNGAVISASVNVTISGNTAARAGGGLESNNATLTLMGTTVGGNSTGVNGGGVHLTGADSAVISGAAILNNTAGQEGGGLWNSASGNMAVSSSTVSGNTALIANAANDAQGGGGAFNNGGTLTLHNTLISSNVVSGTSGGFDDGGGGIFNDGRNAAGARVELTGSTTISDNTVLSTSLNGGGGLNVGAGNGAEIVATSGVQVTGNSAARAGGGLESFNGVLTLTGVTISGNSTGVNGGGVHVTGADQSTISNSTISANTAGQEGGGLWNSATGNMAVTDSTVSGNTALIGNAAGDAQGGGGAFNNGGTLTLHNTLISSNVVSGGVSANVDDGGGGIFNDGRNAAGARIELTGSTTISDNTVLSTSLNGGGGLNVGAGNGAEIVATSGVQVTGNSAARAGGGLESFNGVLTLTGVTISGNSTGVNGGGVHVTGADQSTISNSTISANTAGQEGGGLWNSATGNMTVIDSMISSNTALAGNSFDAQGGGGAFNNGGALTVQGSQFVGNLVQGSLDSTDGGAGIFNDGRNTSGAQVTISDTDFFDNAVVHTSVGLAGRGGAILTIADNANSAEVTITGGTVSGNSAAQAGGGIEMRVLDSGLAGPGSANLSLSGVVIQGNISDNNGAGLHTGGSSGTVSATVLDSSFVGNEASNEGGGIWVESNPDASVEITDSLLDGNNAPNGGGAFMNDSGSPGSLSFTRSAIVRNTANTGGGIDAEGGNLTLTNSTVSSNNAAFGGGINVDFGTTLELRFATIAANVASSQGGGLRLGGGGNVNLLSSILANNTAPTGPDANGNFGTAGYSLISDTSGLTITNSQSTLLNIDAQLGALADNGGSTLTHALLTGSPAADNAENAICPGTDQRGRPRDDGQCDIGAFEFQKLFTVGGTVSGLSGSGLVLQNNGEEELPIGGNGSFTFNTTFTSGSPFSVTVLDPPADPLQFCSVANGSGTVSGADVTDIVVECEDGFTVGGSVIGLKLPGLVLSLNGDSMLLFDMDNDYVFPEVLPDGAEYEVTAELVPNAHDCQIVNASGTIAGADVVDADVACSTDIMFADGFETLEPEPVELND